MKHDFIAHCQCGAVQFGSTAPPVIQLCCHCADCRDATGNDYSEIAFFKTANTDVQGETTAREYLTEAGNKTVRQLCAHCDSAMFDKSEGFPGLIGVFIAQLLPPFQREISSHVWVQSKIPRVALPDGAILFTKGLERRPQ